MTSGEQEPEISGLPSSYRNDPRRENLPGPAKIRAEWVDSYDTNYHRIVRFVMHNGACLQDAQDAAQEAFTQSWALMEDHPDQWLAISHKEAWIRVVALRCYRRPPGTRIRPRLAEGTAIPDQPDPAPGPGELTSQTQIVLQALRGLDEQAQAVMAFYLDGFATSAIAAMLNLTEQRVRDVKKKARATLKIALAGQMPLGRRRPQ